MSSLDIDGYAHFCAFGLLQVTKPFEQKLQRAIAESRGQSVDRPLPTTFARAGSTAGSCRSDESGPESKTKQAESANPGASGVGAKRKYRRHPKVSLHPGPTSWCSSSDIV
jgi:hypothetical protein